MCDCSPKSGPKNALSLFLSLDIYCGRHYCPSSSPARLTTQKWPALRLIRPNMANFCSKSMQARLNYHAHIGPKVTPLFGGLTYLLMFELTFLHLSLAVDVFIFHSLPRRIRIVVTSPIMAHDFLKKVQRETIGSFFEKRSPKGSSSPFLFPFWTANGQRSYSMPQRAIQVLISQEAQKLSWNLIRQL